MEKEVGIVRKNKRLERASRRLTLFNNEVERMWRTSLPSREIVELRNLALVGHLVVADAIDRAENRGLHFNLDLLKDGKHEPTMKELD